MSKSKKLRELLKQKKPLFIPGAYNAMTAQILEMIGFDAVYVPGYGTSACLLGMTDVGLATLPEMVMNARYISNAVSLPAIADADTGFGNAINVRRTVQEFIQAGIAGIHIEDQVMFKRCGHVAGKVLLPFEEAVGKIRAAHDMRNELDPDFLLIARTDARGAAAGGIEEAIRRGNAYREAGADIVFVEGPTSEEEVRRFCQEINAPIFYNATGVSPRFSLEQLGEMGVSVAIIPGAAMRVTARAVYDYFTQLKDKGLLFEAEWQDDFVANHPLGDFHKFTGFPEIRKLEEKYLPEKEAQKYENSVGFKP
ncbi:isocitrate lyase/PEP mutase family protein [Metallumcola ferriviriculae]|uniref:Isocitrate lyase/PEP mutase family protein n=1 Tax=Metallumcola ferriviriculae TaxID=3039180 RepID=A0AAU0UQJ4_9FIRM|nr:isocitrate lyase/PEP mutase family protein [Desulfitibacteraceae bacterium MK1]